MRSVLIGTVESSRIALEELCTAGHAPLALVTLPLEKRARHSDYVDLRPTAAAHKVPVIEEAQVNSPELLAKLRELQPDYLFVVGWSQILSSELLTLPARGCIGYHPAPLPRFRGRGVIPWTILLGEKESGSTLFWLDDGVDSGDIIAQELFSIDAYETAATLMQKHMQALSRAMRQAIPSLACFAAPRAPQDASHASYCAKRTPRDGFIDWRAPAAKIETLVRAVGRPYPGAFTYHRGRRMHVWSAELATTTDAPYMGLPGQIQRIEAKRVLVTCGDGAHLWLTEWNHDGLEPALAFKIHEKFGPDWSELFESFLRKDLSP